MPLLEVSNLRTYFRTDEGEARAVDGVSFTVEAGEVVGIVGESGSGKSVTSLSILRLIPEPPGRILPGSSVRFKGEELVTASEDRLRQIRGNDIAMIFQEPMTSLNPVYTVGNQIEEAILLHQTSDRDEAHRRAVEILRRVGMPNPERIARSYPHQLSGGMRQRAMIAMALSCTPTLLIADEPTTALDVTTEAQILELMRELQADFGMSIMFITHSMGVVAQLCDEVVVMYLGRVVERANVEDLFYNPKHPYTVSLLRSIPRLGVNRGQKLEVIKGSVPDPYSRVPGCPFHPRCPSAMPGLCDKVLPLETPVPGDTAHTVRCHLYPGSTPADAASSTAPNAQPSTAAPSGTDSPAGN